MTAYQWAQVIECGVWWAIGGVIAVIGPKRGMGPRVVVAAVVTLVAFGASDLVESRTGAWYRPWWLFVWKAICVGALLGVMVAARRGTARRKGGVLR